MELCIFLSINSLQMYDIAQVIHLFNGAHLFGLFLANVLVDGEHSLSNEGLRHHGHIAEIIRNEKHPDYGTLGVQQRCLYSSRFWNRISST